MPRSPSQTLAARSPGQRYAPEEIDKGLMGLVACGGNSARAAKALCERGFKVNDRQLRRWRDQRSARYNELANEHSREIEGVIVQEARETAMMAAELERVGLQKAIEQVEKGELRDASTAARNGSVSKGINIDQVLKLTGRPADRRH